ncbi:MAG: precorrin-8X methylmutase [Chloroflexi bacterium]|nr:precorrin-8X methylmutase [Chloroflexota bacterium]
MIARSKRSLLGRHWVPPERIEPLSFEIIGGLLPPTDLSEDEMEVVKRVVHTTGDPEIVRHLRFHPEAIAAGVGAIRQGKSLFVDVKMVAAGINRLLADRHGCQVECLIESPEAAEEARDLSITRAAAGVLRNRWRFEGALVAIGNAPTALLALLDLVDDGHPAPALVVGVPVGFVGAAEAKAALAQRDLPFIATEGTRGGSTMAAGIVNALLKLAAKERGDAHI